MFSITLMARIGGVMLLATAITTAASGPLASAISVDDAARFVGQTRVFCGDFAPESQLTGITAKDPVLLVMGGTPPNEQLTVRIPAGRRSQFSPLVESRLAGRQTCVEGKINAPREAPGHLVVDVTDPIQFKFIGAPPIADSGYPGGPLTGGSDIVMPVPVTRPEPKYSSAALKAELQGTVIMTAVVGVDGMLHAPHIYDSVDPLLGLDDAAINAAVGWRFRPGLRDGQPVPVLITLEMQFTLEPGGSTVGRLGSRRTQTAGPPPDGSGRGSGRRMGNGAASPVAQPPQPVPAPPAQGSSATSSRLTPRVALFAAPHYPLEALRNDWQGVVSLSVTVLDDGHLGDVRVTYTPPDAPANVTEEAVKCVKQWTFEPAIVEGRPVAMTRDVMVRFQFR